MYISSSAPLVRPLSRPDPHQLSEVGTMWETVAARRTRLGCVTIHAFAPATSPKSAKVRMLMKCRSGGEEALESVSVMPSRCRR